MQLHQLGWGVDAVHGPEVSAPTAQMLFAVVDVDGCVAAGYLMGMTDVGSCSACQRWPIPVAEVGEFFDVVDACLELLALKCGIGVFQGDDKERDA